MEQVAAKLEAAKQEAAKLEEARQAPPLAETSEPLDTIPVSLTFIFISPSRQFYVVLVYYYYLFY